MKKLIISILVILATTSITQSLTAQTFAVGPKFGFVASDFRGDDIDRQKFRKGFQVGAFFAFAPVEWFSVQPEIMFDQRGSQEVIFNQQNREIKINYLSVPVALNFRIPIQETFYPKIMVGPYAAFALNESQRLIGTGDDPIFGEADVSRADFGGLIGAGLDIQHNKLFFTFDIRYLFGAVDVSQQDNLEFRNTQIATSTGIGIKF